MGHLGETAQVEVFLQWDCFRNDAGEEFDGNVETGD